MTMDCMLETQDLAMNGGTPLEPTGLCIIYVMRCVYGYCGGFYLFLYLFITYGWYAMNYNFMHKHSSLYA
jgi:hypothetical protein